MCLSYVFSLFSRVLQEEEVHLELPLCPAQVVRHLTMSPALLTLSFMSRIDTSFSFSLTDQHESVSSPTKHVPSVHFSILIFHVCWIIIIIPYYHHTIINSGSSFISNDVCSSRCLISSVMIYIYLLLMSPD